jgi:hypothetical protein
MIYLPMRARTGDIRSWRTAKRRDRDLARNTPAAGPDDLQYMHFTRKSMPRVISRRSGFERSTK